MEGLLLLAFVVGLYFLPTVVGYGKRNAGAIFALNLLTGWTLVGWIAAFIWAATSESQAEAQPSSFDSAVIAQRMEGRSATYGEPVLLRKQEGDPVTYLVEADRGVIGSINGEAARKLAFHAEASGKPKAKVAWVDTATIGIEVKFAAS